MNRAFVLAACLAAGCVSEHGVGSETRVLIGAYVGTTATDETSEESAFTGRENDVGRRFDLDRIFHRWNDAVPGAREAWTIAHGRTPIVSFRGESDTPRWDAIAAGAADDQLGAIADGYRALGAPVLVIFHQKPEEDAETFGSADAYRACFRHIVEIFRAHRADQARWVFTMKSSSYPVLANGFYPGDDVVDWVAVNAFNFGAGEAGGRWISFRAIISDFYAWAKPHDKPMLVAEWGSTEDPADRGHKAAWIRDVHGVLADLPEIRALAYSDGVELPTLTLQSSPEALAAFKDLAADPITRPRGL